MDLFIEHLQAQTVNDKIFPNIVSGFMDTNPVVRESTIKVRCHVFLIEYLKSNSKYVRIEI